MSSARVGAPNIYPLGHPNRVRFVQAQPVAAEPDEPAAAIFPPDESGPKEQEAGTEPTGEAGGEGSEPSAEAVASDSASDATVSALEAEISDVESHVSSVPGQ